MTTHNDCCSMHTLHKDCWLLDEKSANLEKLLDRLERFLTNQVGQEWDYEFDIENEEQGCWVNLRVQITHPDKLELFR